MPAPDFYKTTYLQTRKSEISDDASLRRIIQWAEDHYTCDDTDTRFQVAYSYLAAAEYLEASSQTQQDVQRAAQLFHFAAHHLRKVESWRNAGLAYMVAGSAAARAQDFQWAVRAYARAKQCFADVGDAEEAAEAYIHEQDARRLRACRGRDFASFVTLTLWKCTSLYGQSWRRWLGSVAATLLVFALLYELQFRVGLLQLSEDTLWIPLITPLYHATATILTLGVDERLASGVLPRFTLLANLVFGWALLGIGAGMIARRVKER